ncbi:Cytochrome c556 [Thalassospira xiamenensis]|uniref:Cytochrome c556 n=2 Tax=Thalassospira xiamenensis TaxID=220697 RepID=A0A285U0P0_9PROT|nr:Cytochrome c556 [Thalassospira xiamenensis]
MRPQTRIQTQKETKLMRTGILVVATVFATAISIAAVAHEGAKGVVKERMDGMEVIGKQVKMMVPMLKGETPYDPAKVELAAMKISSHAGSAFTELFPTGSTTAPSEASPEIWEKWDAFSRLSDELAINADMLKTIAAKDVASGSNDTGQFDDAFRNVLQTCKSCHQQFRAD